MGSNVFYSFFVTSYLFLILASIVFDFFCTSILNENMSNTEEKIKLSAWTCRVEVLIKWKSTLKGHMNIISLGPQMCFYWENDIFVKITKALSLLLFKRTVWWKITVSKLLKCQVNWHNCKAGSVPEDLPSF